MAKAAVSASPAVTAQLAGLSKGFGKDASAHPVLEDCSFELETRKLTVLIGPSGCGKSTLINVLAGYERPDAGTVRVLGKPVSGPGSDRLVVFQESALFPWMTTLQNVAYGPLVQRRRARAEVMEEATRLVDLVGLAEFRHKYPNQLSGGMQRRVELARAMINEPALMMLDEPFRGLDAMTRELMQEYFVRLYEDRRLTVLFVSSEIDEAIFLADTVLVMSHRPGRIIKTIPIDLPRPRLPAVLTSLEYLHYKAEALELLHAEAMKAFAAGSKAAADFVDAYAARDEPDSSSG
jgi:sulfonate transport system ATP-binding protein